MLARKYRALDLTTINGTFCGKMLAEIGIDVIKVEPPEGSSERSFAPFYHDEPDREKSLYWCAYNAGKQSITLNLHTTDGRALLRRLVDHADFLIESFTPGYMDGLGLGYAALHDWNPRLIYTAITPFGQSGPRANFAAEDLTILALGGLLNVNGDPDRAPLRFAVEQAYPQAGAQAAAATMIAHEYRSVTGLGQFVDVSMQEAICDTVFLQQQLWDVEKRVVRREGTATTRGGLTIRAVFPCKDGFVSWRIFVGSLGRRMQALVDWMVEEDIADADLLTGIDFAAIGMDDLCQPDIDRWEAIFGRFFKAHTKTELHRGAIARDVMLFPMNNTADLLVDAHLSARAFWREVDHPELGASIRYPGSPVRSTLDRGPAARRAPLLGEHNAEVYGGELGLSEAELSALRHAGVL